MSYWGAKLKRVKSIRNSFQPKLGAGIIRVGGENIGGPDGCPRGGQLKHKRTEKVHGGVSL